MLISITAVAVEKSPKGHTFANVSFTRDGKAETRKIMSFSGDVYKQLLEYKEFPKNVNVTLEKDNKGYWQWKAIESAGGNDGTTGPQNVTASKGNGRVIGSNYETPEERARRQVYIIRQSSISSAIQLLGAQEYSVPVEKVLEIAKTFENYVMDIDLDKAFKEVV